MNENLVGKRVKMHDLDCPVCYFAEAGGVITRLVPRIPKRLVGKVSDTTCYEVLIDEEDRMDFLGAKQLFVRGEFDVVVG